MIFSKIFEKDINIKETVLNSYRIYNVMLAPSILIKPLTEFEIL
jgi:hypothetical protein